MTSSKTKLTLVGLVLLLTSTSPAQDLTVWPNPLYVSPDYPAQVIVLQTQDDQSLDGSHAAELKMTATGLNGVSVAEDGRIVLRDGMTERGATGQLTVQFNGATKTVPIVVSHNQQHSPIFPREVSAVMGKAGCNLGTCHGNLHGKGGFRLSLRGDDPLLDFTSIVRGQGGRRIDRFNSLQSLLIRKPLGQIAHQGGVRFAADSPEARILTRWIDEGSQWNSVTTAAIPRSVDEHRPDEQLESLVVYPSVAVLSQSCRVQQLAVIARFADGTQRDVTRWARYEPSAVTGITIDDRGLVVAQEAMDVSISVSYLTGRAASRLTFLAHKSGQWHQPQADSRLDELVETRLKKLQVEPTPLADDYMFVRRAYLAITGRIPTADEVRHFVGQMPADGHDSQDINYDKHDRLVESLLHDPGYAYLWSMRWSDLLRNEQKVMSEQGAAGWHAWMTERIANDQPLSEFVAEMLTTLGSTYEHPPASFHRTHRDPEAAAESIGQVFLGVRLQCARCHNHPFDKWRQDDYYGLAAYFTTLERKQLDNAPKDKFDKHIISGDEVVSLKPSTQATIWHPGRAADVPPKPLTKNFAASVADEAVDATATATKVDGDAAVPSPLDALARWLTVDNRMFARNMANRIWYHTMGVGIVDPPDDFRDSNPASNPELLEYLTDELIRSNYSTRHVTRLIVTSRTFRRQSTSEATHEDPLGGARVFAGYPMRRMPAEVLFDAISDVTDVYSPGENINTVLQSRAVAQVNVPTKAGFLKTFGKPGRLLVCECERSSDASLGQSLVLVNGLETRDKIEASRNRLSELATQDSMMDKKLETLFLTTLARPPRPEETQRFSDYIQSAPSSRRAMEDVLWALINSKEFSLIR